jgi:hypothetical protein
MNRDIAAKILRGSITWKLRALALSVTMYRDGTNLHGVADSAGVAVLPRVGNNLQEALF